MILDFKCMVVGGFDVVEVGGWRAINMVLSVGLNEVLM